MVGKGYDQVVKYILVGDANVGKTSIVKRFCKGEYLSNEKPTLGLEYDQKIITIGTKRVLVQLWDTAGQQRFKSLTPSYYRSAMAILLVYSVDDRNSFNSIALWLKQIGYLVDEGTPILLIENKADLVKKQVGFKESEALSEIYNLEVIRTSPKHNINIEEAMVRLYEKLRNKKVVLSASNTKLALSPSNTNLCKC